MEGLTKQQIVLVTLLVSFVTSIATGIVTVALMDQAPPGVTQTINRVVERTIEKAVPSPNQAAAVVTKETVVVKEDDMVVQAVEKNTKSLVSIYAVLGTPENTRQIFLGNGLVVGKDGMIATDVKLTNPILDDNQNPIIPQTFLGVFSAGVSLPLTILFSDTATGLVLFKPTLNDKTKNIVFVPASIADVGSLKLGQTVVALGGEKVSVATGIVSNISGAAASSDGTATSTSASDTLANQTIKTDVAIPGKTLGGVLVNLSGDVVGIRATIAGFSDTLFISSSIINSTIKAMGKI